MLLAGDIGGTRSRFYALEGGRVVFEHVYPSQEYKSFTKVLEHFLHLSGLSFSKFVFGIAGVVIDGKCKTTNLPWEVSEHDIKTVLNCSRGYLINDLALLCYGALDLAPQSIEFLQQGEKKTGPMLLICPGTGLGVACAVFSDDKVHILPTEAGHVDFAPVDKQQLSLLDYYFKKLGHVSVERFVSGTGILNIYEYVCHKNQVQSELVSSEQVTDAALSGVDKNAVETCQLFVDMLAATIGNLALSFIPYQGIYLCGSLTRKLAPFLKKDEFLHKMASKGRFDHLIKRLPLCFIKEPHLAIRGALAFLKKNEKDHHGHS